MNSWRNPSRLVIFSSDLVTEAASDVCPDVVSGDFPGHKGLCEYLGLFEDTEEIFSMDFLQI